MRSPQNDRLRSLREKLDRIADRLPEADSDWPKFLLLGELRLLIEFNKARDRGEEPSADMMLQIAAVVRLGMLREANGEDMDRLRQSESAERRAGQVERDRLKYPATFIGNDSPAARRAALRPDLYLIDGDD